MGLMLGLILLLWGTSLGLVLLLDLGLDLHLEEHPWGNRMCLRGAKLWGLKGTQLC